MSSQDDKASASSTKVKEIPYGVSGFATLQQSNAYYVDKTPFIPLLEKTRYVFLIRPRRMGKSLWLSTLENYYDVAAKNNFDPLFGNTWIGQNPTSERNGYLVLRLDFSSVSAHPDKVEDSFNFRGDNAVRNFLNKYAQYFVEDVINRIHSREALSDKLDIIFSHLNGQDVKLYILIDEYDNFANTILSTVGSDVYQQVTHGAGFYREFFSLLKSGTAGGLVDRLFITGVSPVTMDDVTSGFNIGDNVSLSPAFQEVVGFTEQDVSQLLQHYKRAGVLSGDVKDHLSTMRDWYSHYCFANKAKGSMYNSDMVLNYIKNVLRDQHTPESLIDQNVKIDYNKLRHLLFVNRHSAKPLNGNFNALQQIISQGGIASQVVESFPLENVAKRSNFVSLLYYFGLLSFSNREHRGKPFLKIPNQTIQTLMYGYIRDAFEDSQVFNVDLEHFSDLVADMAFEGQWQPVFEFLAQRLQEQTAVRDYIEGEKAVQVFLRTYLHIIDFFITLPEPELNKGFGDIVLEPFLQRYPDIPHAYLIEVKYIPRATNGKEALKAAIEDAHTQAQSQLQQYEQDDGLSRRYQGLTLHKLVIVFHGWELVLCEAVG